MTWTFSFPAPAPLMNLNDRTHWAKKAQQTKAWRTAAWVAATNAKLGALPPCIVTIKLPVRDTRRRDPHNYVPTLKACIDGMVDAGLWSDDDARYVATTEPVLVPKAWTVDVVLEAR